MYVVFFSSWGDAVFLALQTLVIALLVLYDFKNTTKAGAFLFAYLAVIVSIVQKITPMNVVMACQAVNIPVVLAAKVIWLFNDKKELKRRWKYINYVSEVFEILSHSSSDIITSSFVITLIIGRLFCNVKIFFSWLRPGLTTPMAALDNCQQ